VTETNWQLPLRLAALGFAGVIVQIAAVSQITVFGVSVDVAPLLVASVGLLAGSLPGAVFGFAVGLFVDLALVQDLGVTSLLFIVIGYAAGRLRELRDPAHGLVPVIVGAVATAISTVGFALMQFLLGIEAPVSWLLLRQVLVAVLLGALFALPVYALVRRVVSGALPDDPRRRRRRAYTTGGLSPLSRPSQGGR
jgi:rod shape-determining protein MreD